MDRWFAEGVMSQEGAVRELGLLGCGSHSGDQEQLSPSAMAVVKTFSYEPVCNHCNGVFSSEIEERYVV